MTFSRTHASVTTSSRLGGRDRPTAALHAVPSTMAAATQWPDNARTQPAAQPVRTHPDYQQPSRSAYPPTTTSWAAAHQLRRSRSARPTLYHFKLTLHGRAGRAPDPDQLQRTSTRSRAFTPCWRGATVYELYPVIASSRVAAGAAADDRATRLFRGGRSDDKGALHRGHAI